VDIKARTGLSILLRNCLLEHIIAGKTGQIEVTGIQRKRRMTFCDLEGRRE
jgi:hypothetical protein